MQTSTVVSAVDQEAGQACSKGPEETWMTFYALNAERKATTLIIVSHPRPLCDYAVLTFFLWLAGNNKNRPGNRGGLERQRRYGGEND